MLAAEALQHADLDADEIGMEYAKELVRRPRRIGERSQNVEDRAHAKLLSHRRRMLHCAVMVRCEHETDTGLGDALGHLRR